MGKTAIFIIAACINVFYWLSCREFYLRNKAEIMAGLPYVICSAIGPPMMHILVVEFFELKNRDPDNPGYRPGFLMDFVLLSSWTCISCLVHNLFFEQVKSNTSFMFIFQLLFGVPLMYASAHGLPHLITAVSNILWTIRLVFVVMKYSFLKSPQFWCMVELWRNMRQTFRQVFT